MRSLSRHTKAETRYRINCFALYYKFLVLTVDVDYDDYRQFPHKGS